MGPLRNPRHEKFAQLIWLADAKNYRRGLAYRASGYRARLDDKAKSCAADACACCLFKNAQIQARVREIAATAAKRNEVEGGLNDHRPRNFPRPRPEEGPEPSAALPQPRSSNAFAAITRAAEQHLNIPEGGFCCCGSCGEA